MSGGPFLEGAGNALAGRVVGGEEEYFELSNKDVCLRLLLLKR